MAKIDKIGRLGIPQNLRTKYGIKNEVTEVNIVDTENGILIKPISKNYIITDIEMTSLRELYVMLNESGILDSYYDELLSKITKKSESICATCGSNLFLTSSNTLKCYKCK